MELYARQGFEETTVAEIAGRAGVTERTFFRHFADKREVLFGGSSALQDLLVNAVASAPKAAAPIDAVASALQATSTVLTDQQYSRKRQAIIVANADLRERELIKMATLASAMAGALRRRGVPEPAASLTAESGMAVFRIAFERWVAKNNKKDLARLIRESLAELKALVAEVRPIPGPARHERRRVRVAEALL